MMKDIVENDGDSMIQALRQNVIVGPDGKIEIRSTGLKAGTRAEVIVLEQTDSTIGGQPASVPLVSLIGSCKGMFETPQQADEFLRQ